MLYRYAIMAAIALLLIISWHQEGYAHTQQIPETKQQVMLSYAPLVKQTAPAVVNIFTTKKVRIRTSPLLNDPFFGDIFGGHLLGRAREKVVNSLGSGVIVDPKGLIITNLHVVKDAGEIKVVLADNREFVAELALSDPRTDLALLQIKEAGIALPSLHFAQTDDLEVGDIVLAIGNPFGIGQTVTSGIVSALARTTVGISDYEFFIQTDAAINPGNSGGALVNMRGELVGINTAIFSKSGGSHGIGFATPANMAVVIIHSYQRGSDKVVRPWIGAATQNITREIADSLGLERSTGVLVKEIFSGGAADQGGLKVGDVILAINGISILNQEALKFHIATYPLGSEAGFTVLRDGDTLQLRIRMVPPLETVPRQTTTLSGQHPLHGVIVENLSPALAEELSISRYSGVIVKTIERSSPSFNLFKPGDIVLAVNGHEIENVQALQHGLREKRRSWKVKVQRQNHIVMINISH